MKREWDAYQERKRRNPERYLARAEDRGRKAFSLSEPGETLETWLSVCGYYPGEPEREAFERGYHDAATR